MRRASTPVVLLHVGDDGAEGVAVEGIAVQCLGMQHELAALGRGDRGGDRDLAAELVGRAGFALADALDLGRVQRIDLGAALAVILEADPDGQSEQVARSVLKRRIAGDLAADVADDPAEPGAQELELAPGPLELMGVGIAADHDRGALGHPQIALAQRHAVRAWRKPTSFSMARCISRASVGCAIALGCTVVSTTTRSRSLVARAPVLCATDRLSWSSADELLLAEPLAPARQRRAVERQLVAEAHSPQKNW